MERGLLEPTLALIPQPEREGVRLTAEPGDMNGMKVRDREPDM